MQYQRKEKNKKNKKKGLLLTFMFHGLAVALALFPLLNIEQQKQKFEAIVVEFDFGAKAEGAKKVKKKETQEKREVQQLASITKPVPKILTTEQPADLKIPEMKRPDRKVEKIPDPVPSDRPTTTEKTVPKMELPKINKPVPATTDAGGSVGEADGELDENATESGDGTGEKGEGEFDKGESGDKGTGFIEGNGTLSRKVVKRANIDAMVKKEGVIVVKLCVTQSGAVDFVEYDASASTIQDPEVVKAALDAISQYRFETDYDAPARECGRFRYSIEYGF